MDRRLPPEYAGWEEHEPVFRRLTTPELVMEVQDGSPDRRLAALAVIDLSEVAQDTIEDWIRSLPDAEANELAGAIPAQRPHASCEEEWRWVEIASLGFRKRKLPTFLVMLMSSLDAMEARSCQGMTAKWLNVANWLVESYDSLARDGDDDGLADISLFVFENHLHQPQLFDAFCTLVARHQPLALRVSTDPEMFLLGLGPDRQQRALAAAEAGGGLPASEAWEALEDDA